MKAVRVNFGILIHVTSSSVSRILSEKDILRDMLNILQVEDIKIQFLEHLSINYTGFPITLPAVH